MQLYSHLGTDKCEWHTLMILTLERLRQENREVWASLGYIAKPCLQKEKRKKEKKERSCLLQPTLSPSAMLSLCPGPVGPLIPFLNLSSAL